MGKTTELPRVSETAQLGKKLDKEMVKLAQNKGSANSMAYVSDLIGKRAEIAVQAAEARGQKAAKKG